MTKLDQFAADLREGRASRASLFWLKTFIEHAQQGMLRSDEWIERGLQAGERVPGLDVTDPAPRLALLTHYSLFEAIRLKDQQAFSGEALASLDWHRKYNLSLLPDIQSNGQSLQEWVEVLWSEIGGASPQDVALEKLLVEHSPLWGRDAPLRSLL